MFEELGIVVGGKVGAIVSPAAFFPSQRGTGNE
jgi:hypothetical protein